MARQPSPPRNSRPKHTQTEQPTWETWTLHPAAVTLPKLWIIKYPSTQRGRNKISLTFRAVFSEECQKLTNLTGYRAQIALFSAYEAEHRVFYVYVPGLLFMLNVGPDTDKTRRPLCLWNNPDRPILSSGVLLDKFTAQCRHTFATRLGGLGVSDAIIDQLLGHSPRGVLRFYTARVPNISETRLICWKNCEALRQGRLPRQR